MTWLQNMSVPPRTTVTLHQAPCTDLVSSRACYNLAHAIQHGLPWPDCARLPGPVAQFCNGKAPLKPWLLLTLLKLADSTDEDAETCVKRIRQAPREITPDAAAAALEEACRRRNLHGAMLVRPVNSPKETSLQNDLVLTLLLLSQSTDRVFVAGKQPVLGRLHPLLTLEVIIPESLPSQEVQR